MQHIFTMGFIAFFPLCVGTHDAANNTRGLDHPNLLSKELISQQDGTVAFSVYLTQDEASKRPIKPFQFEVRRVTEQVAGKGLSEQQIVARIPDILTHDRVGDPAAVRSACSQWDPEQGILYVAIGKTIGQGIIINLYRIDMKQIVGRGTDTQCSRELVAASERHFAKSNLNPKLAKLDRSDDRLEVELVFDGEATPRQWFELNLSTKTTEWRSMPPK